MGDNTKQRFSLRKLSIGMCSVILGLLFMGAQGQDAQAASVQPNTGKTSLTVISENKNGDSTKQIDSVKQNSNLNNSADKLTLSVNQVNSNTVPNNVSKAESNKSPQNQNFEDNYELSQKQQDKEVSNDIDTTHQSVEMSAKTSINKNKISQARLLLTSFYAAPSSSPWHKVGNNWTYSKADGSKAESEWVVAPDGQWYYFDYDGNMVTDGWKEVNNNGKWNYYYFDSNGHYSKNAWHRAYGGWTLSKKDGTRAESEWAVAPDGQWYYFEDNGEMAANGWVETSYDSHWKYYYGEGT